MPEWYYLPFYAILRAIPNKLLGVIALFGSIVHPGLPAVARHLAGALGELPAAYRQFFWIFVVVCVGLGWLGSKPPEGGYVIAARILTLYYFVHFLIILPLLGLIEKTKPLPNSISEAVLQEGLPIGASGRRRRQPRLEADR